MCLRKRLLILSLEISIAVVSIYGNAFSYKLFQDEKGNYAKWNPQDIPVTYTINKSNFTANEIQAVHRAFATWGFVGGSRLRFKFKGYTDKTRGLEDPPSDNDHLIVKLINLPPDTGWAAFTKYYIDPSDGHITDADIVFNGDIDWNKGSFEWPFWPWDDLEYDMESIALHEIGHLVGIDHPYGDKFPPANKRESVVEPISSGEKWRDLLLDDVNAVLFLYGTTCNIFVGQKALPPEKFLDAYDRNGGKRGLAMWKSL